MGDGYTKLFSDIVDSSIWDEDAETCKVWVTLLASCNPDGFVRGSIGWLCSKARVSAAVCETALAKFQAPDLQSRTPDNEGRRIERLEDGWLILNYLLFRDRLSSNPVAIKTRERVRKHRERYNALRNVTSVTPTHSEGEDSTCTEKKGIVKGNGEKTPLRLRVEAFYRRRPATRWSENELKAWHKLEPVSEEDVALLEIYYLATIAKEDDIRRRDMITLLNNWNGELDRARKFQPKTSYSRHL